MAKLPCAGVWTSLDPELAVTLNGAMSDASTDILPLIARGDVNGLQAALSEGADANARDRWGATALMHAAARGDVDMLDLLLKHGAEAERTSDAGNSALMAAVARGHLAAASRLLDAGLDPTHQNKWGVSAYDWAKWPANSAELLNVLRAG